MSRRPRHPRPDLPSRELSAGWQAASLLLDYPDERLLAELPVVRAAVSLLPRHVGTPILEVADWLASTPLESSQAAYVDTFDTRRRSSLYLTYFTHGDTRRRGVALLRFKQAYLRSGFVLGDSELPDHLGVVLEYAATVDQQLGWALLLEHRAALEVLRLALHEDGSPWAAAVDSVCATFPPLRGHEFDAVRRLASEGPPEEEVGLDPDGAAALDPTRPAGAVDLPTPAVRGAGA